MALESDVLTKTNHKNKYKKPNFEHFIGNIRNNISSNDDGKGLSTLSKPKIGC